MQDYSNRKLGVRGPSPRGIFKTFRGTVPPQHLPAELSYKGWFGPVFDQGDEPDCVGNGIAGALTMFWHKRTMSPQNPNGTLIDFSRAAIYSQGKLDYEGGDFTTQGMYPASGLQLIQDKGPVLERDFPSTDANVEITKPLASGLFQAKYRITTFVEIDNDVVSAKVGMHGGGPLEMAVDWPNSWFNPNADGTLLAPDYSAGGHFVDGVAYSDLHQAFLIRNSWGDGWGIGGYAWLPYRYLASQAMNLYTIRVPAIAA